MSLLVLFSGTGGPAEPTPPLTPIMIGTIVDYSQRIWDTGLAQYVYYTSAPPTDAPSSVDTTPNHSGSIDSTTHAILGAVTANLEYRLPVGLEGYREYSVTQSEVLIARFELSPGNAGKQAMNLYFVGVLTNNGGSPTCALRMYDMGAPNAPQPGDLRASIVTTATGGIRREDRALTASESPTTPGGGPNDGTIYNATRIYELRAIFTGGAAGDTMQYDTVGVLA